MQRDRLDLKEDLAGRSHSRLDQILDDFLLAIDRDRSPAGELGQVYSMPGAAKAQLDTVMKESFPAQPLTDTGCNQQIDTSLLQHAGSNALLDVRTALTLQDDRVHAQPMEQVPKQQSGGTRADDADLGSPADHRDSQRKTRKHSR